MTPWLTKPEQPHPAGAHSTTTRPPRVQSETQSQSADASSQEPIPLADLQDAELTLGQVAIYLAELLSTRARVHILVKSFAEERPSAGLPLEDLLSALSSGKVRSAQLRYRYQSSGWIDTLITSPRGVRLIRTATP